jgi:hypothetical protein
MTMNTYAHTQSAAGASQTIKEAVRYSRKQARAARAATVMRLAGQVGPWVLFAILMVGGVHWTEFNREADAAGRVEVISAASTSAPDFEYFPHQYVNQAKRYEEHVQAF